MNGSSARPAERADGRYRSVITVAARRLTGPVSWTSSAGSRLTGAAGDWLLSHEDDSWTVTDDGFRAMYRQRTDGRWSKVVSVDARRVTEQVEVATPEGPSRARPGDWLLTVAGVGQWPVTDETFRRRYERVIR